MAFREVRVFEVREVLRLWLRGEGLRSLERLVGLDRKTVRRYVGAAVELGLAREGGEGQLDDGFLGAVCERVRPGRPNGHGQAWATLVARHDRIKAWLDDGLTVVKIGTLLAREGVVVPERTLHRYALVACEHGRGRRTVRVADGEPGAELQVDFGRMGLVPDPVAGRSRVCHALIFTACWSRHCFVWLTFTQTTVEVIAGFEAAWSFFGGVFKVVIPDNLKAIVEHADPTGPRLSQAFVEYAQARGFVIDAARVPPSGQAACGADRVLCAVVVLFGRDVPRLGGRAMPSGALVSRRRRVASPWDHPASSRRGVRARGGVLSARPAR